MRSSHVATALAAFSAGLTASAVLRRLARPRLGAAPAAEAADTAPLPPGEDGDAVVLPFTRPVAPLSVPERPSGPIRCGDTGGRTKAGAPCAARASAGGRCHHHPMAA